MRRGWFLASDGQFLNAERSEKTVSAEAGGLRLLNLQSGNTGVTFSGHEVPVVLCSQSMLPFNGIMSCQERAFVIKRPGVFVDLGMGGIATFARSL